MKNGELVEELKLIWENDHAEEVSKAYNKIVKVLGKLDVYSANMVVNLISLQTVEKSLACTVGRFVVEEEVTEEELEENEEVIRNGRMERSGFESE